MKLGKLLLSLVVVSLIVSMAIPMGTAKKPPKPPGGEEPPADPAIAYGAGRHGRGLYVMNADGTNQVEVYMAETQVKDKSWSPDGNSIAFTITMELWVIDIVMVDGEPQGSNPRMLLDDTYPGSNAWSPAGDEIAVARVHHPGYMSATKIQVIPVTGGEPETLHSVPDGWGVKDPTWSPDGTQIAFLEHNTGGTISSIKILDRATKTVTSTLDPGMYRLTGGLNWARTQDVLAFTALEILGAPNSIHTLDINNGATSKIYNGYAPSWSPDDTKLVFNRREFVNQKKTVNKIEIVDLATLEITILATGASADWKR